jgi:hypothetical protein
MKSVIVVPEGNGYKVLYNFIQYGITYSTIEQAIKEANELKAKINSHKKVA